MGPARADLGSYRPDVDLLKATVSGSHVNIGDEHLLHPYHRSVNRKSSLSILEGLQRRMAVGNLRLDLPQLIHRLFRATPFPQYDRVPISGKFSPISAGMRKPRPHYPASGRSQWPFLHRRPAGMGVNLLFDAFLSRHPRALLVDLTGHSPAVPTARPRFSSWVLSDPFSARRYPPYSRGP
jgi:hypothetical protein